MMDRKTIEGKQFKKLYTHDKKMLFLLEGIYDKLETPRSYNYELDKIQKILKFIVETQIASLQIQNTDSYWTEPYIKELKERLKYL